MAEEDAEEGKNVPPACVGCIRWKQFGKKCFYFWEGKKNCSMFTASADEI